MKNRSPLYLLLGITSIALSGLSELNTKASAGQQTPKSRTDTHNPDKINTYSLALQSEQKIENPKEVMKGFNLRQSTEISEKTKVVVTPVINTPIARLPSEAPQLSVSQNIPLDQTENVSTSIASEPDKVGNEIPTVAEAKLPPLATTQNSATLLEQTEALNQLDQATIAQTSKEEQFPPAKEVVPDEVDPGRSTRSGPSYIGVGANFGVGGDTSLGDSGLFLYSKIGLTRYFSVRPGVNTDFDEDATFLLPLTFDLAPIAVGDTGVSLAPYFGGGPALSTTGDFGPVISGGVDMPLTERLTATSGVNIGILDEVDVGVFVGVGYTFSGF